MSTNYFESSLEQTALNWFRDLNYQVLYGPDIAPDSDKDTPERSSYKEVVLVERLREALTRINPDIPTEGIEQAAQQITKPEYPTLIQNNRQFQKWVIDGIPVTWEGSDRTIGSRVKLFDLDNVDNNDWLAVNQFTVKGVHQTRRLDIVIFVNGLPIAVIELKNHADEDADIWKAYEQLQTYKEEINDIFLFNEALIISDGFNARVGSLTADKERFQFWRTLESEKDQPAFEFELQTLILGFFNKKLLLDFIRYFVLFEEDKTKIIKKIAGYHQFHAVREAVQQTLRATQKNQDGRCGVIWHTQGSGKSIAMTCYAAKLMTHPEMNAPTVLVVTDRNDLDGQLYDTFCNAIEILHTTPQKAESREELRKLLDRPSGGIIFTTIQKFAPMENEERFPTLSTRHNIVVISDEAHRSQYGLKARIRQTDGKMVYGYAKHLRDALPNAGFIGFTGTPIELNDRDTRAVFGDHISIYDIEQAVKDKATVPIYYESRQAALHLTMPTEQIDNEFTGVMEDHPTYYVEKKKTEWTTLEKLVTAESRIKQIAKDLVEHWENRLTIIDGKALIVCISREACVQMYNELIALRPEWAGSMDNSDKPNVNDGAIRIMMTGTASDRKELRNHAYDKTEKKVLENRCKNPDDPLKIMIVCDMWLTGFDAPCLHTMYIDKPMQGHSLMQAIARINRVFKDKPGGLIVDYIGIANELRQAMQTYTQSHGKGKPTIDVKEALAVLLEKIDVARAILHGFDYRNYADQNSILQLIGGACNHILGLEKGKDRFSEVVLAITKANALCGTLEQALLLRDEIAFFQAIKAALNKKSEVKQKQNDQQVQSALKQVISKALVSDKVIDIFDVAGLKRPEISIISDEFLETIRHLSQRNLAVEMLERLLKNEIRVRSSNNIVQARKYSELLKQSLLKYQNRSIETAQVVEELIQTAKNLNEELRRGEKLNLNQDELAFYDALERNEAAVRELGDTVLRKIAMELTEKLRRSNTVDWAVRESVRAKLRILVRQTLRKYKYPPDQQEGAIELVLEQAENLSAQWSTENSYA